MLEVVSKTKFGKILFWNSNMAAMGRRVPKCFFAEKVCITNITSFKEYAMW